MRSYLAAGVVSTASLVLGLAVPATTGAIGTYSGPVTGGAASALSAQAATVISCKVVPASDVTRVVGTSVVGHRGGPDRETLGAMGRTALVGGKPVTVQWLSCGFGHTSSASAPIVVTLSYLIEPTAARATKFLTAVCAAMRPVAQNYATPRVGGGACVQGHGGSMLSSNGFVVVHNALVGAFGNVSPPQSVSLLEAIARRLAPLRLTGPAAGASPSGKTPVISVTTTQYLLATSGVFVGLSCAASKCTGEAQLTVATVGGTDVLAASKYNAAAKGSIRLTLALTADGLSYFAAQTAGPIQVTLMVTVTGGRTVTEVISVLTSPVPTTGVTTTEMTTTTVA